MFCSSYKTIFLNPDLIVKREYIPAHEESAYPIVVHIDMLHISEVNIFKEVGYNNPLLFYSPYYVI